MIIRTPLNEFQTALYNLLSKGQTVEVYDKLPNADVQMPFIWLGVLQDSPVDENKTTYLHEITQYIHVFSDYAGKKEMDGIINDIIYLLSKYDLPMAHFHVIRNHLETVTANGEDYQEGHTSYHGIIVYKFEILQEA